jgi:hypothetical protein
VRYAAKSIYWDMPSKAMEVGIDDEPFLEMQAHFDNDHIILSCIVAQNMCVWPILSLIHQCILYSRKDLIHIFGKWQIKLHANC